MKDAYEIVHESLAMYEGQKKVAGDTLMIVCPFHHDRTPSCGVYMVSGMDIPLGYFNCLGCGAKGHWNILAEKCGFPTFKSFQVIEGSAEAFLNKINKDENKILGEVATTLKDLTKTMGRPSYFPWDTYTDWRGFDGKFINKVEGYSMVDSWKGNADMVLFLPVKINGKYYGGVRAQLKKIGKRASYVNTTGDWTKDYGLFPYDFVKKMVKKRKLKFVVLVEGPRDALRLIINGIPALAVLGARNFSATKLRLVLKLADDVYVMPDNDLGGVELKNNIKERFAEVVPDMKPKIISLPRDKDKDGKLIKLDPMAMPYKFVKSLRKMFKETYDIKRLPKYKGWM